MVRKGALQYPKPEEDPKPECALSEIEVAEAARQQIQNGGNAGTFRDKGLGAGSHLASCKERIKKRENIYKYGYTERDPPQEGEKLSIRITEVSGIDCRHAKKENRQGPEASCKLAAVKLPGSWENER
jgi:hypothetical protein